MKLTIEVCDNHAHLVLETESVMMKTILAGDQKGRDARTLMEALHSLSAAGQSLDLDASLVSPLARMLLDKQLATDVVTKTLAVNLVSCKNLLEVLV